MNGGPSGFNNAPVTRIFLIACALFTVFFGIQGRSFKLGLSYQDIFRKLSIWKLIVSVFAFSSTPELMFGLYLLYYFRVFERQIGSNKYSVFILFSVMVSFFFEVMALAILKDPTANLLTSGPYGLIFASFVPFYFDIPVSTWFRIFGVRFSDKSFIYLAGLQLLLSSWKRSLLPGICGILAGSLYRLNVFHIRRAKSSLSLLRPSSHGFLGLLRGTHLQLQQGILQEMYLPTQPAKRSFYFVCMRIKWERHEMKLQVERRR
ncbi:Ubiquitin-associated domain-containing protein 2 isoform 3 [Theobroma cacao]|uniref:Ubiquitin-associated domain-containing protein 2 isoform 3 n=1 Tax=Theobroma cacao TaxID=3641 RepID=A0A061EUS8_THECC|nr:Ubiquitin-associated domain-containing protein 2 isoform 3 [Theobroma cacao]